MAAMISSTHEEPVCEIAQGILLRTQFQHFIPEVAEPAQPSTDVQRSSPPPGVHLEEIDVTYPHDGAESSQYQSSPLPDCHMTAYYYRKKRKRHSQLKRVDEGDEH